MRREITVRYREHKPLLLKQLQHVYPQHSPKQLQQLLEQLVLHSENPLIIHENTFKPEGSERDWIRLWNFNTPNYMLTFALPDKLTILHLDKVSNIYELFYHPLPKTLKSIRVQPSSEHLNWRHSHPLPEGLEELTISTPTQRRMADTDSEDFHVMFEWHQ